MSGFLPVFYTGLIILLAVSMTVLAVASALRPDAAVNNDTDD